MHRKSRLDLFMRVLARYPALPASVSADIPRVFRLWDVSMARAHAAAWGHMFRDEMRRLLASAQSGDMDKLTRFGERMMRTVPVAEVRA